MVAKKEQRYFAFAFGTVFTATILVVAVYFPSPTEFQYLVFRIVLSIATAGVAAMVPGFMEVEVSGWIRAGGALAVFLIVFFYNPASLVAAPHAQQPLEARVTIQAGPHDAGQLVGSLGGLTGGVLLDPEVMARLKGRTITIDQPLSDVPLGIALDLIFKQLGISVEYEEKGDSVVIRLGGAS